MSHLGFTCRCFTHFPSSLYCGLPYFKPFLSVESDLLCTLNSQGAEIFPFSYFENPWLECDLVRKDNKYINIFHKTRTYGLNFE